MKGQVSIEFIAAFFLFIIAVVGTMAHISSDIPSFTGNMDEKSGYLEASTVSKKILTKPGKHSYSGEGTDWERNSDTIESIESFGLSSEHLVIEEDKLESISTNGDSVFNYSQFRQVEDTDHQYSFTFTWLPVIDTHKKFVKGSPAPEINSVPQTDYYENSDPIVHYGSTQIHGNDYTFLITSHLGSYNTTYVSQDWNFAGVEPNGTGQSFSLYGESFTVESFQNRENTPGSILVLSQQVKEFGAPQPLDTRTVSLNRYAVYNAENSDKHPMRVEVLAW